MICPHCDGEGTIEVEFYVRQSFSVDSGYIDTETVECECCNGSGEIEDEDDA